MNKYVIIDKDGKMKQVDAKTALAHFKEEKAKTPAKKRGRPAKKSAVVSKKGTKPSKIEKPAPKKRGRPAKTVKPVAVVKKIKKELKKKGK